MDNFADKLNLALQKMYDQSATCKAGVLSPVAIDRGIILLQNLGYPDSLLNLLPQKCFEHVFPMANPLTMIGRINPKSILDLGCGTGIDALFCAHLLPELTHLIGIDTSSGLLDKGREIIDSFSKQAHKITLTQADLNHFEKLQPGRFDLILMNGSFNLVYDKARFLKRLPRFLTGNGTVLIYDFILTESLPPGFSNDLDNWLWNIGGALGKTELNEMLNDAELKLGSFTELERIDPVARCEIITTVK